MTEGSGTGDAAFPDLDVHGEADDGTYTRIHDLVRAQTAFRLDDYKPATIKRRIARRLDALKLDSVADYVERLRADKDEANALVRETFIGVTAFFRDAGPFHALERLVESLVRTQVGPGVIRAWVPGCATGEEAYGLAFLFEEALRDTGRDDVQYLIFASDVNDAALERARAGVYPAGDVEALPLEIRTRYLEGPGEQVRVVKQIRNRIVFAHQNVADDPPFARLSLISCRNVLIYFVPAAQRRVLELFHYALDPGGHLLLGRSESSEATPELFTTVDAKERLYRRNDVPTRYSLPLRPGLPSPGAARPRPRPEDGPDATARRVNDALLEAYAPPSVVVDDEDRAVHFRGNLKPFLRFPEGPADLSVFALVDQSVRAELRALVYAARRVQAPVTGGSWTLPVGGRPHRVRARVSPFGPAPGHLLVCFEAALAERPDAERATAEGPFIVELERDLADARAHLSLVVEELETSNDELQSVNRELHSANEDLQSANEELQTANEELQASNEELCTVNEEIRQKSAELATTLDDLVNVKESLGFPLIVVDADLRVTHANQACGALLTAEGVVGRSLAALAWSVDVTGLVDRVRRVIDRGEAFERDVVAGGTTYLVRATPCHADAEGRTGAVIVFEDVSEVRGAVAALADQRRRLLGILDGTDAGTWEWHVPSGEVRINARWAEIVGHTLEELLPATVETLRPLSDPGDRERALAEVARHFAGETPMFEWERQLRHKDGKTVWVLDRGAVATRTPDGAPEWVLGTRLDVTPRKTAELAVAHKEAQLRALVRSAPTGLAMFDQEMRYLEASGRWRDLVGIGDQPIVGRRLYDVVPWSIQFRPKHLRALSGEHVVVDQVAVQRPDGQPGWNRAELAPWHQLDGSIGGIVMHVEDITAQVLARQQLEDMNAELERRVTARVAELDAAREELARTVERRDVALRENQRNLAILQGMFDSLPVGIVLYDADLRATTWNAEFVNVLRLPPDFVEQPWGATELVALLHARGELISNEPPRIMATRLATAKQVERHLRDGRWVDVRIVSLPGGELLVAYTDVTALKQSQERLAEAKARLELAMSAGLVGIWSIDFKTGEFEADDVARRLTGLPAGGPLRSDDVRTHIEAASAEDRDKWYGLLSGASAEGPRHFEFEFRPTVGDPRVVANRGTLVFDGAGAPLRAVGVLTDVTAHKDLEAALRERAEAAAKAHEQALQRTLHLQKMELVGNLTSGIAHDFNNLLSVFGFAVDSLHGHVDLADADAREAIEDLTHAVERATLLTRQLLGFGRARTDERVPVDAEVALRAIGTLLPRLTGGRFAVKIDAEPDTWIMGSRAGLEQIVLNLAVNARDAMPDGGTLTCRLAKAGNEVRLSVSDTGVGMDEATRARVFEPFFTTKSTGTGLGMTTVLDVAQRCGGTVDIESAAGRGTTVTVTFPRIERPVARADRSDPAAAAPRGGRALLVEDDLLVRRSTQRVLESLGFEVIAVANGREAIGFLSQAQDVDLVVSDVSMPEMDGVALASELAVLRPTLPVVLISGNPAPQNSGLEHPHRAFLQKPATIHALLTAIDRARHARRR